MKILGVFLALALVTVGTAQSVDERRAKAEALKEDGNWREAADMWTLLLREVSDGRTASDLGNAVATLTGKGQFDEAVGLLEFAAERHGERWDVLMEAGVNYRLRIPHGGLRKDGEIVRDNRRYWNGWLNLTERDRVRSLQLLRAAYALVVEDGGDEERAKVVSELGEALLWARDSRESVWALWTLTDLSRLPDAEDGGRSRSGSGAPVDDESAPLWLDVSDSWEDARNDGERWRWCLVEAARLHRQAEGGETQASELELRWLEFVRRHYGVQTLASYGWFQAAEDDEQEGILQVHTLAESESLARLANGVRRFELPADYRYLPGLRRLSGEGGLAQAGDALVDCLLNRRQFSAAAVELKRVMQFHGDPNERRSKLLAQIEDNWGKFEAAPMFPAGTEPKVDFTYRNSETAALTLHEVKLDLLIEDIIRYLEGNPEEISWEQTDITSVGRRLINDEAPRYRGEQVADWEEDLSPREGHWTSRSSLKVPVKKAGVYLLEATLEGGNSSWIMLWLSDAALVRQQVGDEVIYYLGGAANAAPIAGSLELFGYRIERRDRNAQGQRRHEVLTRKMTAEIGEDGVARLERGALEGDYRWLAVARGKAGERALIGFDYTRWRSGETRTHQQETSFFLSDRPVYRPGQTVKVKFWSREARYDLEDEESLYAGQACEVVIRDARGEEVAKFKNLRTDKWGGVEVEHALPADAALGTYYVVIDGEVPRGSGNFRVEEYKKPEFEVVIEAPEEPAALGEVMEATISATYYHGVPVTEGTVQVKVQRHAHTDRWFPGGRWDWLFGKGYWWCGVAAPWYPGWNDWGCFPPTPPWWRRERWTPPELVMEKEVPLGPDGTVSIEIDTSLAKLMHGDIDHRYEITADVVDSSRRTISATGQVLVARQPFKVTTWLGQGYYRPGEQVVAHYAAHTIDGKPVETTGEARLIRVTLENDEVKEEVVQTWDLDGGEQLEFAAPPSGQYRLAFVLTDERGRSAEGATVFPVRGEDDPTRGGRFGDLELILRKNELKPGESAQLLVNTNEPDARVLLFLRAEYGAAESFQVLEMDGQSREVEVPVTLADMPNIFVQAVTIARGEVVTAVRQILLPPESRVLNVSVSPDREEYRPREEGKVRVKLTDAEGNPFQGTAVVTVYDKSLEYISGGSNVRKLAETFWQWKRSFSDNLRHSQTYRGRNLLKKGQTGMGQLGVFGDRFLPQEFDEEDGAGGVFGGAGGRISRRASLGVDQFAMDAMDAMPMPAMAAKGMEAKAENGEAGEPAPVMVRSEFADLLKWVGDIETDENGEAVIDLEMPDNLTTWVVRTWALGDGTRVGEGTAEFLTNKDLMVRLQAPRFFVEGDEVVLSAIVHNYHEDSKEVAVSLELEGGVVIDPASTPSRTIEIPTGGEHRVNWLVRAEREGEVTVRMKAIAADDSDAMEQSFPVYVHGMPRTESWSRAIDPGGDRTVIDFEIPEKRRPAESLLQVRYSPTIAGALVDALPYLADYPHGCTEQTLNRFVPAVVTQKLLTDLGVDLAEVKNKRANLNPQEIGDAKDRAAQWKRWQRNPVWDEAEVDVMVAAGVKRLMQMQNDDGGWGWFSGYGQYSSAHTTLVVVHGLQLARENGVELPGQMLEQGVEWLKRHEEAEAERIRMWQKREHNTKKHADATDAAVRQVLGENKVSNAEMLGFLVRDKNELPVYAKCLLGLELDRLGQVAERDRVLRNIEQHLQKDDENQTAWLDLGNRGYWWRWYGSEFEALAAYLKLLSKVEPKGETARRIAKYLLNNRKHANYWRSTRDTASCIEALAAFLRASGEGAPDMEIDVILDGKVLKTVKVTKESLFTFDGTAIVAGDILGAGRHRLELRKTGTGPLYANAYLTVFTLEDHIEKAGLEVKVERALYKLVPVEEDEKVAGSTGQVATQRREKFKRVRIENDSAVQSGDLVEVELSIESKNDYSYLVFDDWKAAGMESAGVQSGYNGEGLGAYMELRDEKVSLYVQNLPRGKHNLRYRLRAEIPGRFSALPTRAEAMYAPELKANSDEIKVRILDR